MASYPTSVKSFTNRSAGQTIASAHINDLQDEVNALEAGLLQGSAPLNSSNSTLANLSVSGGSTLTELFVTKTPPFVSVTSTSDLAVANAAFTVLSFTNQRTISTSVMHSTASNQSRLIPPSSGVYQIVGNVIWPASTAGTRIVELLLNSTTPMARQSVPPSSAATVGQSVSLLRNMSTSDYVELRVYQDSGSTSSITASNEYPSFAMVKVR